ncbi:MAG: hypothetical protein LBU17_12425 [Treponema sp.]|nr:hypothetical protein [Treponema sp.]
MNINKKLFVPGILSMALVFGLLLTGCPTDDDGDGGGSGSSDTIITTAAIAGVTVPVTGDTPVTTITDTPQYSGTVTWAPPAATFAATTVYTATISLTPKAGYTLNGVTANFFTVAGASPAATNAANTGVVNAAFPATGAAANPAPDANAGPTVTLLQDNQKFHVNWTAVTGASGYRVVWGRGFDIPPTTLTAANSFEITSGSTTFYIVTNVTNGDDYNVWVSTKKSDGTYSSYSEKKTVRPMASDAAPAKPVVTVTPTDDGQLRITWPPAQWAEMYSVRINTVNDSMSTTAILNATDILDTIYTTTDNDLPVPGGPVYYVWVSAKNVGNVVTASEAASASVVEPPASAAQLDNTTWISPAGATYKFTVPNSVVFTPSSGAPQDGSFTYLNPPTLIITIGDGVAQNTTIKGKTFALGNTTFTKQ